ncbi:MAG: hypothetical protein ABJN65_01870 [Parasphingorhabdus sp.]
MTFNIIDFLIGFLLMNAMPHMLFGLMNIRFFSAFGFSPLGNLAYAELNIIAALTLFHFQYGISSLTDQGFIVGALAMLTIYMLTGKFFFNRFQKPVST